MDQWFDFVESLGWVKKVSEASELQTGGYVLFGGGKTPSSWLFD